LLLLSCTNDGAFFSHSPGNKSYSAVPPPSNPQAQQSHGFSTPNMARVPSNSKPNHFQPGNQPFSAPTNTVPVSANPHCPPTQGGSGDVPDLQKSKPGRMPPTMKDYVTRAFSSASTESEREFVHRYLDDKLNKIFAENQQWSIDWDRYPMPL